MSKALRHGMGTSTNTVAAYAWLKLAADSGMTVPRVELNKLALSLDFRSIQRAEAMAAEFKAGKWQAPPLRTVAEGDPRLKLGAITLGKPPLAVINGKTLAEGETASIPLKPQPLRVKCLQIHKDAVVISIEGEGSPRQLSLK